MAKRSATSDINHDNWDRDEEPEEAGTFSRADHERLKKRVIKVAKRRNLSSTQVSRRYFEITSFSCVLFIYF